MTGVVALVVVTGGAGVLVTGGVALVVVVVAGGAGTEGPRLFFFLLDLPFFLLRGLPPLDLRSLSWWVINAPVSGSSCS